MISSVFGYPVKCFNNITSAITAYKAGDIDTLSELSGTFAKETVTGVAKLAVATVNAEIIECVTADSKAEGIFNLLTPMKLVTAATTIVNGVATVATGAVTATATLKGYGETYHALRNGTTV